MQLPRFFLRKRYPILAGGICFFLLFMVGIAIVVGHFVRLNHTLAIQAQEQQIQSASDHLRFHFQSLASDLTQFERFFAGTGIKDDAELVRYVHRLQAHRQDDIQAIIIFGPNGRPLAASLPSLASYENFQLKCAAESKRHPKGICLSKIVNLSSPGTPLQESARTSFAPLDLGLVLHADVFMRGEKKADIVFLLKAESFFKQFELAFAGRGTGSEFILQDDGRVLFHREVGLRGRLVSELPASRMFSHVFPFKGTTEMIVRPSGDRETLLARRVELGGQGWIIGALAPATSLSPGTFSLIYTLAGMVVALGLITVGLVYALMRLGHAEEGLRNSEGRLRSVFSAARDVAFTVTTLDETAPLITEFSPGAENIFGYSRNEIIGTPAAMLYPSGDEGSMPHELERVQSTGESSAMETMLQRKTGKPFPAIQTIHPLFDDNGTMTATLRVAIDITQRKQAENALAEEKERLRVTLRSIGDGVIAAGKDGRVELLNLVAEQLTGWKQEDAVGGLLGNVFHIMNEKTRERCANPFEKIMNTGQIVGLANNTVLVARDRTERIIADSGAPIRDRDGELIGVILVFRDITEQRKLEEELGRSQKLESVGLLAAGIAHDFNNILTAIMGNISLATLNTYPETKISDYLNNAEKAILRAKHLTEQLLTFSKGGMPVTSLAELGELLREAATFALRGSNVKCEYSIADDLWPAEIDSGQISQVFHNLVLNGKQAMPEGGVITIKAENFSYNNLREKQGDLPLAAGDYLVVNISDQGSGIPEKALQKIFDPYFTTKEEGQGLGLATSHAIVKKHNGHVSVYSKVGFGTTFTIYLPASPDQVMGDEQEKSADLPVGAGRILVMDDEDIVLEVAGQMVTELGYEPSIAKDGKETIILFQQAMEEQRPFDLVILDLTIPGGMGGKETIQRLLELDPRIKAMVSSGYSNDPVLAEYKTYGFCGIIEKPYNINELAKAIQNARG